MTLEPRAFLRACVAIASPSGEERELAAFVADELRSAGLGVERVGDSVLACLALGPGPRVLFNSHLDTVPVGAGWTRPALGADWHDGVLYGRGANDAKASVTAMVTALCGLAREDGARDGMRGELWLALTAREEIDHAGMTAVLDRLGEPEGAVTGEPTGLEVVRAQAGLAVLRAEWHGRACHAAHVARVEHSSALFAAAAEVVATRPYVSLGARHELLGESTLVATVLRSGERHNVVPDRAEALFDCRLAPPSDAAQARETLRRLLPTAEVEVRSARLAPVETAADHPLVRAALRAAGKTRAIGSATLSDMALLAGVPAVKCGPGQSARSHTPDEFVRADELLAGCAFYRALAPLALRALAVAPAF